MYKVESDFEHAGCRCVVIMTEMGHRCGYVGIDKNHPLFGIEYTGKANCLKTDEMPEIPMEKAGLGQMLQGMMGEYQNDSITPEMFFSVHGGITFSGGGPSKYPVISTLWWFGYDCAHSGDAKDLSIIENPDIRACYAFCNHGVIRSKHYCEQECKSLAEQLKAVADKAISHV